MTKQPLDEHIHDRLIALTRDLILIPSIPSRPDDIRRAFEVIKNHLESLDQIEVKEYEHEGSPSLVAVPTGVDNPKILMCGHLDVITHEDPASYRSHIEDGRIYGPGAGDMKGALAILMEVFRNFHSHHPGVSLGLAVTSDEEVGGEAGIGHLISNEGLRCQEAMIPDGGSLNNITIEEKGILHLKITCLGKSAHAARPWLGENPIDKLLDGLQRLKVYFDEMKLNDTKWYPTCAITIIETENQTVNRIPANAQATLDVRFPPPHTTSDMLQEIKKNLSKDILVKKIISAEPTNLSPDPDYLKITESVTGKKTTLVKDDGGSDARYIAHLGVPVVMSRPIVGNLHAKDEWIDIESMVQFYQIYEKFLTKKLI